jgi:Family of unknown function (DUF6049)
VDRDRRRPRLFGPHLRGGTPLGTGAPCVLIGVLIAFATVTVAVLTTAAVVTAPIAVAAGAEPARAAPHTPGGMATADAVDASHTSVTSSAGDGPALDLVTQTSWVTPGQSFDLHLHVTTGARSASQLGLAIDVYPCLSSVSGFDQSVAASGPSGTPFTSSQPVPLGSLPSLGAGDVNLSMPVVVDGNPVAGAPFTINLVQTAAQCQAFPAGGVFPVRVQLVNVSDGTVLSSLVTHLVYSETTPGDQLRVAVVIPVQLGLTTGSATLAELTTRPSAALRPPSATELASVSGVVGAMASHPTVPVTLSVSGQALEALSAAGRQTTLNQLAALAIDAPDHDALFAPFVPVDATALVDAGLSDELALQVARGAQVAAPVTHQSPTPQTATGLGTWVTNESLDAGTVGALDADGYRQVVLPPSAVSQSPVNGSAAIPFTVSGSHDSQLAAVASNPDLTARFAAASSDPVLAAHQLVAELAQIFFEAPNSDTPRGVVVVPPTDWSPNPAFTNALLDALDGNPLLAPVTLAGLFAAVPASTSCHADCRLTPGSAGSPLPAASIANQRRRVNALSSAVVGVAGHTLTTQISDLVLAGQSDLLRPAEQLSVETEAGRAIDAQLQHVVVAGGLTLTLTSQQSTLPVTVASSAPYDVHATLSLSSDKLLFPNGATQWTRPGVVTLLPAPHTNVIDVPVRSRGSGIFTVDVVLRTPVGGIQMSAGSIDIRSTAASVVGIALSAGAVIVLAVWWIRTSRRRRTARRREEATDEPQVPIGVP